MGTAGLPLHGADIDVGRGAVRHSWPSRNGLQVRGMPTLDGSAICAAVYYCWRGQKAREADCYMPNR